jgi:DNA processing protein
VENAAQIKNVMNWRTIEKPKQIQKQLFVELSSTEQAIYDYVKQSPGKALDEVANHCGLTVSQASAPILNLELNGLIRTLPGKRLEPV